MDIYGLNEELVFPHPSLASEEGLLAIGGDLSVKRLLLAYENGIFPWYNEDEPILWWSPDPRIIIDPKDYHISKSTKKFIKKSNYKVTFDKDFLSVMQLCMEMREDTWISDEIIDAYYRLYLLGYGHSVEVWENDELIGGLYGLAIGSCFCGESMFSKKKNASKIGFYILCEFLNKNGFDMIDCQVPNEYLLSLGGRLIKRDEFLSRLKDNVQRDIDNIKWENNLSVKSLVEEK